MAPPTIIAHKSAFLATQTLHLSQALAPSATWRASNDGAEKAALPPRAVDDAIYRLNHVLAQHARRVYAPQASRYLAEQIEALFYEEAERAVLRADGDDEGEGGGEGGTDVDRQRLRVGADFSMSYFSFFSFSFVHTTASRSPYTRKVLNGNRLPQAGIQRKK